MARWYWYDEDGKQKVSSYHPQHSRPISAAVEWLQPALISDLHLSFARWSAAATWPGPLTPHRVWIDQSGLMAVRFATGAPSPQPSVGASEGLAQWLVLLDKWMETYVVLARARAVWPLAELGAALPFITPCLLPHPLVKVPPDNWERVARGLAAIVVDGPLPNERLSASDA